MPLGFQHLLDGYPRPAGPQMVDKATLFKSVLRGGFATLVTDPNYDNTCAIRLSVSLIRAGELIAASYGQMEGNLKDGDGRTVLVKVETMEKFLLAKVSPNPWGMSKNPGTPFDFGILPNGKGILLYRANFSGATGHVDLWNGVACAGDCPAPDAGAAYAVSFWRLP